MLLALAHAPLITADGIQDVPLVIDTRSGRITSARAASRAIKINLDGYMLLPGLVNAHDHLELNHFPRTRFREVCPNAHVWGDEVSARLNEPPFDVLRAFPLRDRCLIGGLKNLLCGVTTVAHHNALYRPLKARGFPVGVLRRYGWAHSLHFETHKQVRNSCRQTDPTTPWMIHLAEGTDVAAAGELRQLRDLGALRANTVLIHGVGLAAEDARRAIEQGASLVWCPSTNHYLLGQTADVRPWAESGQVALGSDSRLTAAGDLLDELRAASATGQLDELTLFRLVTLYPRRILRLQEVGDLKPGMRADVMALPLHNNPYRALVQTRRADLSFVMRGGKTMLGDPEVVAKFPQRTFETVRLDGREKWMARGLVNQIGRCSIAEPGLEV